MQKLQRVESPDIKGNYESKSQPQAAKQQTQSKIDIYHKDSLKD